MDPFSEDPRIQALRRRMARVVPRTVPLAGGVARASVALVVRPAPADLEVLVIRRALRAGDPWSGHMALPGGRRDPGDADALATAMRETAEEVGVELGRCGSVLGALDEVAPRGGAPLVAISPFVFAVPAETGTTTNHEVDLAVWIPLAELGAADAATEYLHAISSGEHLRFPAIGYREFVIWGLTHRIVTQFLQVALSSMQEERGE